MCKDACEVSLSLATKHCAAMSLLAAPVPSVRPCRVSQRAALNTGFLAGFRLLSGEFCDTSHIPSAPVGEGHSKHMCVLPALHAFGVSEKRE